MAHIIDGKRIAAETRADISRRVAEFENENGGCNREVSSGDRA